MFALIETGAQLQTGLEQALARVGLSLAKHRVLATLAEAGGSMRLSELAARQHCVRSNITQMVDRLEHESLVRREPDPADRRTIRAVLTSEGRARARAGAEEVAQVENAFLESIPTRDRSALRRLLGRLER